MIMKTQRVMGCFKYEGVCLVCANCMDENDWEGITKDSVVVPEELEKEDEWIFFCDICRERMVAED